MRVCTGISALQLAAIGASFLLAVLCLDMFWVKLPEELHDGDIAPTSGSRFPSEPLCRSAVAVQHRKKKPGAGEPGFSLLNSHGRGIRTWQKGNYHFRPLGLENVAA